MNISLFYFLAFLAILSALMVVISKNPVHSVLYLIICFFAIAGHYVLMNAQSKWLKVAATVSGGLLMTVLVGALRQATTTVASVPNSDVGLIENLGLVLFREYALPFEVSSILLLTAMVGTVMLGKKEIN